MDDDAAAVPAIEPSIDLLAAARLCAPVHPSREEALAVARRLRAAGWVVPLYDSPVGPRSDDTWVVAVLHHPNGFERIGEVRYRTE